MNTSIHVARLPEFDMASQLRDETDIAEYLNMVLEERQMQENSLKME